MAIRGVESHADDLKQRLLEKCIEQDPAVKKARVAVARTESDLAEANGAEAAAGNAVSNAKFTLDKAVGALLAAGRALASAKPAYIPAAQKAIARAQVAFNKADKAYGETEIHRAPVTTCREGGAA